MLYAPVDLSHLGKGTRESNHLGQPLTLTHDIGKVLTLFFYFSGNHIFKGRAAGIAVNENGKGLITGRSGNLLEPWPAKQSAAKPTSLALPPASPSP